MAALLKVASRFDCSLDVTTYQVISAFLQYWQDAAGRKVFSNPDMSLNEGVCEFFAQAARCWVLLIERVLP
jgi:hypothetical protein